MIIKDQYNPEEDFTPEGRKRIYSMYREFLKETNEDNNLLDNEKKELKREIYAEMQNYEVEYEKYHENIGIVKKLFLGEKIRSFSLN